MAREDKPPQNEWEKLEALEKKRRAQLEELKYRRPVTVANPEPQPQSQPQPPPSHPRAPTTHAPPPRPATAAGGLAAPAGNSFEAKLEGNFPRGLGQDDEKPPLSRWASVNELVRGNWRYEPGAYFLGYRAGQVIARKDDRHLLLVAGSRGFKGVSVILPNLLLWPGSVLAIDPKGELAEKTAGHRSRSQRVVILDPFNASKRDSRDGFNPLEEINLEAEDASDQAALIADGLIVHEGGDRHWTDAAKQLVQAIILFVVLTRPEAERHLGVVRDFLTLAHPSTTPRPPVEGQPKPPPDQRLYEILAGCVNEDRPDLAALVGGVGTSMLAVPDKERGSIRSSAVTQTAFLDSFPLGERLRQSSFRLRDLKRGDPDGKRVTVYLCLPARYMNTHSRWLRIIINMALAAMEDESIPPPDPPVLMVLEEFNVLGHMASIATAAGQIAGFGVRLLTVLQDLSQLKRHYKESWETFIGNAGLFIAFSNSDTTTLEYISKKLGTRTIPVVTQNEVTHSAALAGASGVNTSFRTDPLAAPYELEQAFARERNRMLVLFPGSKPIILERSVSHEDGNFKPLLHRP